jgi:hypothetical protein
MRGVAFVRLRDELLIKASLTQPGLIARDEQNAPSARIESECHSPDSTRGIKPKLLHVGVFRPFQRVHISYLASMNAWRRGSPGPTTASPATDFHRRSPINANHSSSVSTVTPISAALLSLEPAPGPATT